MNAIADRYVSLVLALGVHDPDYVDAYYGPPEMRAAAADGEAAPAAIRASAVALLWPSSTSVTPAATSSWPSAISTSGASSSRWSRRADMLAGTKMSFDEESQALYDAVAPRLGEDHFQPILAELDQLLPGPGP